MKKKQFLLVTILAFLFFIHSCKKDKDELATETNTETTLLNDAKIFYQSHTTQTFSSKLQESVYEKNRPLWENSSTFSQLDGSKIILTKYPEYKISNQSISYLRSYLFVENQRKIQDGFIIEVFGDEAFLEENQKKIFSNYNRESLEGFNGKILIYDLNYRLIDGRLFKDGKKLPGRANIVKKSRLSAKSATPIASTMSEGVCTAYYLVTTYYDEYGVPYKQTSEFLYADCAPGGGGGPGTGGGGGTPPEQISYDCAGIPNGTAYQASCGCIRGTTGIPSCPKDPCLERYNVSSRASSSAVSSQKSTIINNSTQNEWGAEQNIDVWPGGTTFIPVTARTDGASSSFSPNFSWNPSSGYTLGAAHGHPGGTGPSPSDVFWMIKNTGNAQLLAAGEDAVAYYKSNVSVTTYTPDGTAFVVQINDWPGMIQEFSNFFNTATMTQNYNSNYVTEAQNYLAANNSNDVGLAGVYALLTLMGDKITVYKSEPQSNTFTPLQKSGTNIQNKPCN